MIRRLAFVLGFTSIIGQILLLRELVTVFYGNETAYAIILASWLFWAAAGSGAAAFLIRRIKNPRRVILVFQWTIAVVLPLTLITARCLKPLLGLQTGEIISISRMCLAAYLLLAPLTFLLGALFTWICRFADTHPSDDEQESAQSVGNIYLWEAAGAATGGLLFSFILIHILPAMHMAFLMGAINIAAGMFLYDKKHAFFKFAAGVIVLIIFAFSSGVIGKLDQGTRRIQWKGMEVMAVTDSIYGNIAMTRIGDTYSLYENGLLSFTTKDDLTSEENVHFPLLEHPKPRRVLLIGNGLGGELREILKHPVTRVDYVELDAKVVDIAKTYLPAEFLRSLKDDRVQIFHTDARWLVKRSTRQYDVIIVNLSDPFTALINRYYSLEFFKEAGDILTPDGILSLSVSSSQNYLSKEARAFLRSLNSTLKQVFPDVRSIPGDTNIFLACKRRGVLALDPQVLVHRLKERRITTKYIREYYLPFKLSRDRISYIEDVLKQDGVLNTDTHPVAYLYDIILWSTHFDTLFKNIMERFQGVRGYHLMIFPLIVFLAGWGVRKIAPASPITVSIMTTGFSEIIFQVMVILAFQTLYGYAYYKIGIIISSFMAGLVIGSLAAKRLMRQGTPKDLLGIYKVIQLGVCLYPLMLPFLFILFRDTVSTQQNLGIFATTFAALPVIAGFLGGLQYPLAVCLVAGKRGEAGQAAGFLYGVDAFGAAIGALVTGAILIPLFGINTVAFFCAALNIAVLFLLIGVNSPQSVGNK